jgi:hypothetical protein
MERTDGTDRPVGPGEGRRRHRRRPAEASGPSAGTPPEAGHPGPATPTSPQAPAPESSAPRRGRPGSGPPDRQQPRRRRREDDERGLRDLVGAGPSWLGVDGALRARDVNRPTAEDLAEAEREVQVVRRHWTPPDGGGVRRPKRP